MRINDKSFDEWTEEDLQVLLNNEDFRESQIIDYKRTFEFLEASDKNSKAAGKNEFRNDVCSFANADGGDVFFGISEVKGVPSSILPIKIDNADNFELELRNILLSIIPGPPSVKFRFIPADAGYVVIVHIERGIYKPYTTVENQTTFRFFVRHENRKDPMSYPEISNNFLHAASLASEIKSFRTERIAAILEDYVGMFGVIHVIPASFMNPAERMSVVDLAREGKLKISEVLRCHTRGGRMLPNVDGVWFPPDEPEKDIEQLRIFNNGSVELRQNLYTLPDNKGIDCLVNFEFIEAIEEIIEGTEALYGELGKHSTVYVCTSVIGCKGYYNYQSVNVGFIQPSKVDRDRIFCEPIEIRDILDHDEVAEIIEECKKRTRYAMGLHGDDWMRK